MMPNPSREPFAVPCLPTLAAVLLAAACTAPNPDFRPLGLVVADTTTKQSADLAFEVRIDAQEAPVTVEYEAVDGTAVMGREYLETKGTLTLEPGTTTASIVVPTLLYNHIPGDVNLKLNVTATRRTVTDAQTGTGTITPIAELARFISIESGPYHACGITPERTVKCWNHNTRWDLTGLNNVSTISAGVWHTCAVTAGAVKCWGQNYSGQLGNNSTMDSDVPVEVLSGVSTVAAGGNHTCAVTQLDGKVRCWGQIYIDDGLGNLMTTGTLAPVEIERLFGVTAVAAGENHTCAVTRDGEVKCWGDNSKGQLGNGSTTASSVPVDVKDSTGNNLAGVTSITAGLQHTCALTARGTVHCWGGNEQGQLGNNSTERSLVATSGVPNVSGVTALTAGYDHTCAIVAQGAVKCWGRGGSLGNNSTATSLAPVDVVGLTGIKVITAGFGNTLALTAEGTVKGWGGNALGSNLTTNTEVPIDLAGFTDVTSIARDASGFVSDEGVERNRTCARTAQKTVRCTTREDGLKGVDVAGLTEVTSVAVGLGYTCAVTSQGNVQCVGRNAEGQLGNNSTMDSDAPVLVDGLDSVTSIASGGTHTCVLTAEGRVKCWGDNTSGQLGNNSTSAPLVPVDTGLTGVTSIATGKQKTYAVTSDGNVKRWGLRTPFGPNGPIIDAKPVDFTELAGITSIAVGENHACALTSQGTVKCWGQNYSGELGNNSTIDSAVPVNVAGLSGVTSISAGYSHTCALTSQGTAMCWGDGRSFGAPSSTTTTVPSEAFAGQKVLEIIAGNYMTMLITAHRTARQVGFLRYNVQVPVDTVYVLK